MDIKKVFWVVGIIFFGIAIIILMIRFIYGGPEDLWICEARGWAQHGSPRDPKPDRPCGEVKKEATSTQGVNIANPASVFCLDEGGSLSFRLDSTGGQYVVCEFSDGRECEEWDYYRTKKCGNTGPIPPGTMEQIPTY